ncbi:MAG: dTDP-4-dehydrorhamnose reductase [Spirochaetaceae bacterium]|jgi:dTDP-4-dehydrorhamnose reductase|nr:dTDP-4-dehydrorhamnose reductase [Spirochaetaceae bacterium]
MIWIIGSKGMLGTELGRVLSEKGVTYAGSDRETDILSPSALKEFAEKQPGRIRWIINCSAYTAVDKAEDEPETARRLNEDGVRNIASIAKELGAGFIHFSTDYVFSGESSVPYTEEDPVCPIGVYGETKAAGEKAALEENGATWILRTAWLYGEYGNNFVHTMLRLMEERDSIGVVSDQHGSPTWTADLAEAVIRLMGMSSVPGTAVPGTVPPGIYHFTGAGITTWYDFACEIYRLGQEKRLLTKECAVEPVSSAEYKTRAKRPAWSVLDTAKIAHTLDMTIPRWQDSLNEFLEEKAKMRKTAWGTSKKDS